MNNQNNNPESRKLPTQQPNESTGSDALSSDNSVKSTQDAKLHVDTPSVEGHFIYNPKSEPEPKITSNNLITWPTVIALLQDACFIFFIYLLYVGGHSEVNAFDGLGALFLLPVLGILTTTNLVAAIYYLWRKRNGRPSWETNLVVVSLLVTVLSPFIVPHFLGLWN